MNTHEDFAARRAVLIRASLSIPGAVCSDTTQRNAPEAEPYRYVQLRVEGDAAIDSILDLVRVAMEARAYLTMHTDGLPDGPSVSIAIHGPLASAEAEVSP